MRSFFARNPSFIDLGIGLDGSSGDDGRFDISQLTPIDDVCLLRIDEISKVTGINRFVVDFDRNRHDARSIGSNGFD